MWTETSVSSRQVRSHARHRLWLLTAIILVGAALRIHPLSDFRFHPDEALFATLGRLIASGQDPLLHQTSLLVDKPPLFYYLLAGGVSLNWGADLVARLPGLFASILLLALAARLAKRLWHSDLSAVSAAVLLSLSPFVIQFAPTAFADPILVMWVLASLIAVVEKHWGWSGLLIGCAVATKQSGLMFLPLVAALGLVQHIGAGQQLRDLLGWLRKWLVGFGSIMALIALWVWARHATMSFWQAGVAANDPGRFIRADEVWARLAGWGNWLSFTTASYWLNLVVVGGTACMLVWLVIRHSQGRTTANSIVVASFIIAYMGMLWLVAFPLLDRYLLPVVVLGLILVAGLTGDLIRTNRTRRFALIFLALVVAGMIAQSLLAAKGKYPVGGDHGQFDGIDEVASALSDLPEGSVVYYTSLGWPLAYYLFDAPVYLASVDSGAALANDLMAFASEDPEMVRMLVLPGWESEIEILGPARQLGFHIEPDLTARNRWGERSFVLYRILPRED